MVQATIRKISASDINIISGAFEEQGWHKPVQQYEKYFAEQLTNTRLVLIALHENEFAGYLTIMWESDYSFFSREAIPEITDLNVLKKFQNKGIATQLLDFAENLISEKSEFVGIGVGLTTDYGMAQQLYVKRGYIPDGNGLIKSNHQLQHGETITIDDDLTIYFTKKIRLNKAHL